VEVLCGRLARMQGLKTLAISTNGVLLQEKARALREAGVNNVNISLDTLRADRFGEVTLRSDFESVMRGIDAALQAGFTSVKINTVVMRGVNDDELLDFVGFAVDRCLQVRFIEYMPFLGNEWTEARCMPYAEMRHAIESACRLVPLTHDSSDGTAKEFAVGDTNTVVGFITTMSEHFCSSCSRLRLTADGKLRNCLFASGEIDLRALLRSGAGRDAIVHAIDTSLQLKWEKHPGPEQLLADQNRAMIAIGG
jgi:molybdenum cofactor biosynthesis enzyme MoaA